jgi:hypothetical protein
MTDFIEQAFASLCTEAVASGRIRGGLRLFQAIYVRDRAAGLIRVVA